MRNEIFSRINQNKIQYYSELKNNQMEPKFEGDSIPYNNKIIEDPIEEPVVKKILFRSLNSIDYSLIIVIYSAINRKLNGWTSVTLERTKKMNDYLASKANKHSYKLTEGLSKISSKLFEDSYEFHEREDISMETELYKNKSQALGLIDSSSAVSALPLQSNNDQLIDQLNNWLCKIYRDIIIFLESDNWFEEINRSQKITPLISKNMSIMIRNRTSRFLKSLDVISILKEKKKNPEDIGNKDNLRKIYDLVYSKTLNWLNWLKTAIILAINRFI